MIEGARALEPGRIRARLTDVEPAPKHEDQVSSAQSDVRPTVAVAANHPDAILMIVGQYVDRHKGVYNRDTEPRDELPESIYSPG